MNTYLVGGAVRDLQLGLPVYDRDWVVVGASISEMLDKGYQQVGKDFPVFLHPKTKEEYALARTERKSGPGYSGFECISDPNITLEQDLLRRDLTINAMAHDHQQQLIDPYHGLSDIQNKKLRHVSQAFTEDPLRVLRVARFAARFYHLGFSIADETLLLMQQISSNGELTSISPERIWVETEKALKTEHPHIYFSVLKECGALQLLFPEIAQLFGVPQTEQHHPEIDTGIHTLMVLEQASLKSNDTTVRFAALVHDLGKGITPKSEWPRHIQHETRGKALVKALCQRLRAPKHYTELALLVCEYHLHSHRAYDLKPATIAKLFKSLDLYRRPERLTPFLLSCEADSRGRKGFEQRAYPQADYLQRCFQASVNITAKDLKQQDLSGAEIGLAIEQQRIQAIKAIKLQVTHPSSHTSNQTSHD